MKSILKTCLLFFLLFTFFTGIVYPFLITGLASLLFPAQANGSLLYQNGKVIGSRLLGQDFISDKYFQGRITSDNVSGGSNYASTNKLWLQKVEARVRKIRINNGLSDKQMVPSDLVTQSASGFDPHISIESTYLQIPRVAKVRNISEAKIKEIVDKVIEDNAWSFFGEETINVLQLNLLLDEYVK